MFMKEVYGIHLRKAQNASNEKAQTEVHESAASPEWIYLTRCCVPVEAFDGVMICYDTLYVLVNDMGHMRYFLNFVASLFFQDVPWIH